MLVKKINMITAVLFTAVIFIGLIIPGCASQRQVNDVLAQLEEVKQQNAETQAKIDKMESVIMEGANAGTRLRTDVSSSNDYIQQQIDLLLENYNQLLTIVNQINQKVNTKTVLRGSVGENTITQQPQTIQTPPPSTTMPTQPADQPSVDCVDLYDQAFILVTQEDYEQAIDGFNTYLKDCSKHESAENAYYWIGECYYALEKYVDASDNFNYLLDNFKGSVKSSQALYKLARSQQELGKKAEAKKIYQKIIDDYPSTLEASQAKERLNDL